MTGVGARLLDEESTSGVVGMQRGLGREEFRGITWFLGGNRGGSLAHSVLRGERGLKEINRPPPQPHQRFIPFYFVQILFLPGLESKPSCPTTCPPRNRTSATGLSLEHRYQCFLQPKGPQRCGAFLPRLA